MKEIVVRLCGVVLSALALIAQAESPRDEARDTALPLTESQMDSVTAGALFVSADAFATTEGSGGLTYTNTEAHTNTGRYVERGVARATAFACCGPETSTGISLAGDADGAIVKQITRTRIIQTTTYSMTTGWIRVISINPPPLVPQP